MSKVHQLHNNPDALRVHTALKRAVDEHAGGIPLVSLIGILEVVKLELVSQTAGE